MKQPRLDEFDEGTRGQIAALGPVIRMKTSLAKGLEGEQLLMFWCPGCDEAHGPIVARVRPERPLWVWNGDRDRPTLSPSILVQGKRPITNEEADRILAGEALAIPDRVCHSFVRDGQIEFLSDCTHALAGRTVSLPEWPYAE